MESGFPAIAIWIFIIAAPMVALWAAVFGVRNETFFIADAAAVVLSPVVFFVVGVMREGLRTGWALFLWPVIIFVVCAYAYGAKVLLMNGQIKAERRAANAFLITSVAVSAALALTVSPWYE